mgnify:FL=1
MIVSWDVQITILLDRAFIHAGSSENQHELFSSRLQIHEAPKPQTWPNNHMPFATHLYLCEEVCGCGYF